MSIIPRNSRLLHDISHTALVSYFVVLPWRTCLCRSICPNLKIMPAAAKKQDKKGGKVELGPAVLSGVYVFPNCDKYDGEYIQTEEGLQRHGHGVHTTSEGLSYHGKWEDDKMNGQGRLLHPSGASYEGQFVNNMFHGYGKYTWSDGSFYEGNFNENKLEGHGTFTDVHSQVWYGNFTHKAAPGLKFKLNL